MTAPAGEAALERLVAEADTGGRKPTGVPAKLLLVIALAWSLFQVWYASPLPFALGVLVLNDTEARAIHLAFAVFLAFLAYPALKSSPRDRIPMHDWMLAAIGAFCAAYLFLFYRELATRPGQPTLIDLGVAGIGLMVLLEATRRAVGWPMVVLALAFIGYSLAGPYMPELLAHKGASLNRMLQQQWLTTEGVYGIALGVSTSYIFIFVLFGALLDKAGAGNYMMKVSFAMLGHLRGGPAKVSVVSSALNGLISGSSVSNVVSGGIFTIPLMKRCGYGGIKAGAIETASSVDGQIMPPVMGAAAFLMVEYVGIPYSEIIKHAFLPAVISYISLFYITHLEALKLGLEPLQRTRIKSARERLLGWGLGISGTIAVCAVVYYGALGLQALFGAAGLWVFGATMLGVYIALLRYAARFPDLEIDDPNAPVLRLPETWETVRTGLHFLIPIGVLIWCLMIAQLSPGLSAFWATVTITLLLASQRPIIALFRNKKNVSKYFFQGLKEVLEGFELGARNMIGIGVATATAGIIVGAITLTGMGLMMTDFIESISGGSVLVMLLLTAVISLILGMGVPTTANYILVATLMAPVIVELGAQGGLIVPLIAVHLFVFYFGIMADITPPVGLASFAAAAISGEDPIKTGVQGFVYALRTVIIPFVFIYNPQILMIGVTSWIEATLVVLAAILATLSFAMVTMGWFQTRNRWYETLLLALITFMLFRPDFFMDRIIPRYRDAAAADIMRVATQSPEDSQLVFVVEGRNLEGDTIRKTVSLPLGPEGDGAERIARSGVRIIAATGGTVLGSIRFGSYAKRIGLESGWKIVSVKLPNDRPAVHWLYLPAVAVLGAVYWLQRRRSMFHVKHAEGLQSSAL